MATAKGMSLQNTSSHCLRHKRISSNRLEYNVKTNYCCVLEDFKFGHFTSLFRWRHQSKYVKNARAGPAGRVGRAEPVRRAGTVGRAGREACDLNHCCFSLNMQTSDDLVIA